MLVIMKNVYQEILTALTTNKVNFIVAGGVAAVLHGVERVTMDVDIALEMEDVNLKRFLDAIRSLSLKPRVPVKDDFILSKNNRELLVKEKNALVFTYDHPSNPFFHLDIFLTEDLAYSKLMQDCDTFDLDGVEIKVVSIPKLIELKKNVDIERSKDDHDIIELEKILKNKN